MIDNEVKLREMYITMCSLLEYGQFLEDIQNNDINFKYIDFDKLYAIFIGLFFTTVIDEYIEIMDKDGVKSAKILLNSNFVDSLALIISEKKDDRYYLPGGLSYKSSAALIDKVRNKLAHGDYIVKDGNICFIEKNIEVQITIKKLILFINEFNNAYKKNKLDGVNNHIVINSYDTYIYRKMEINEETLVEYLSKMTVCSIKNKPHNKRNQKYVDLYDKVDRYILKLIKDYPKITSSEVLKKVKSKYDIESVGMELEISFDKLVDKEYFKNVLDYYHHNNQLLNMGKRDYVNATIDKLINRYENKYIMKSHCLEGIALNMTLIRLKQQCPKMKIIDTLELLGINPKNKEITNMIVELFLTNYEDALVSTYLGGFNALYQYGLEKGYRMLGDYTIAKLANGNYLDFSQLEIDNLYCEESKVEYKFNSYETNLENYNSDLNEKKYIDSLEKAMKRKRKYLANVPKEKQDVKKIAMFEEIINEELKKLNEYWKQGINSKYFLKNLDKDLFIKNIDTITHIRNAIAHGFVYINSYDNRESLDKDVTFIDKDDKGNIVYKKTISMKDFVQIFKMKNFYVLQNFMLYNIGDKSKLNIDYSDILNERIDAKKVYKKSL